MKKLIVILFLFGSIASNAQKYYSDNKKANAQYEKAITYWLQGKTSQAIKAFEKTLEIEPRFIEANFMLGDIYADTKNMIKAKQCYLNGVLTDSSYYTKGWYWLANIEMNDTNYNLAKEYYSIFLRLDTENIDLQPLAQKGIKEAHFRQYAMANPVPFSPTNMGTMINTMFDEYLPALTADEQTIIITRKEPRKATTTANTPEEEDFYIATKDNNGNWTMAQRVDEPLNSNDNEGAQCISQDGRFIVFTICGEGGMGSCDLYWSKKVGNRWSKPRNLGAAVNSRYWDSQPSFSIDGKTLYFTSNRPGGKGGKDIWKTTLKANGQWGKAVNMGDSINTPQDETCPFIHYDDQTLYFASNGHIGMGGFDIFYSRKLNDTTWSMPTNIGYPINTSGEEMNLIVGAGGKMAIFSSDKLEGYGGQDLYTFELYPEAQPVATTYMKGRVFDEKSKQPLAADFRIIDLENENEVVSATADPVTGSFLISLPVNKNYALNVSMDGYLFHSENIELLSGTPDEPFLKNVGMKQLSVGESVVLKNVFFETNKYDLKDESRVELMKLHSFMQNNPAVSIEISGHTDNVGNDNNNQTLSENRAQAIYNFLIENGIEADRLSYKGYGETQPIDTNDTEEGRANNRRSEFKIKEITK
jgi:outer membrane protein OmpA-like peptidoglycan-associated protein/tetratricopeptide (TPR) repeat protein